MEGVTVWHRIEVWDNQAKSWFSYGRNFDELNLCIRVASDVSPKNTKVRIVHVVTTQYASEIYGNRKAINEAANAMKGGERC